MGNISCYEIGESDGSYNGVKIEYLKGFSVSSWVDYYGIISHCTSPPHCITGSGKFIENNKINLYVDFCSGSGGGYNQTINGTKREGREK